MDDWTVSLASERAESYRKRCYRRRRALGVVGTEPKVPQGVLQDAYDVGDDLVVLINETDEFSGQSERPARTEDVLGRRARHVLTSLFRKGIDEPHQDQKARGAQRREVGGLDCEVLGDCGISAVVQSPEKPGHRPADVVEVNQVEDGQRGCQLPLDPGILAGGEGSLASLAAIGLVAVDLRSSATASPRAHWPTGGQGRLCYSRQLMAPRWGARPTQAS